MSVGPLIAAIILSAIYILSGQLTFERLRNSNLWLSAAAGVTIAYVFVDLLPDLSLVNARAVAMHSAALFPQRMIYIAALLGFVVFYSLEHIPPRAQDIGRAAESGLCDLICLLDIVGFAMYSGLVAYFLNRWVRQGVLALFFYTIAMALHFIVVGHSLQERQGEFYRRATCYILACFALLGWGVAVIISIPESALDRLVGFVAGGVIINSVTREMPREGYLRFPAFILGALIYGALLLLAG